MTTENGYKRSSLLFLQPFPRHDALEMPLANICGHGDVQVPTRDVVIKCCKKAGLKVEKFEIRKGMRMHCVVRKPMGKAIGNER